MLHVSVLGELAITGDGTGARRGSPRAIALVAFLAAHAEARQARQLIAGLFWPDSTDAQALTNLRRELHHLRQVLGGEPSLTVTARDLCWRDTQTCRVDMRVFDLACEAARQAAEAGDGGQALRHATTALAQYRGDLLPGMYDDWLLPVRSRLEDQCVQMCDLVSDAKAHSGDLAGAMEAARRRIQLRPLEEAGYRTLMQLQADLGDRAGAVSTYHHCASVLDRELGIIPDPVTRQAFQRLLARDEQAGAPAIPAAEPAVVRSGRAGRQLVGRSREMAVLAEAWHASAAGRPRVALVRGSAGVGKTRLATELAERARMQGAVVASSQCFGTSGRLALAPVADWMRSPAVQSAAATLDEVWRAEVGRLVPSGERPGRGAGSRAMADAWQRHRFFEGLARALLAVGRPLLLVLDNMQWCDQETLTFLTFCLGLAPEAQILVAGTLRNDGLDEESALDAWTSRMRATGLLTEVSLGPFETADTARLAEAISGRRLSDADVELLQATTGGFPLYVIEAVRGTVETGPAETGAGAAIQPARDLTSVLQGRLEQLTAPSRDVAGLAAAVGTDFSLDLLTEASDLGAGAVVEAVDELWRRRILRELGEGYDFSHDLLREAAYAQVSPPRRWLLHRRIAQSLELLHADDTDLVSAQLADQYARGGRPGQAIGYYRRAADISAARFAHAEAIRMHRMALAIVTGLPEGKARDNQELALLEAMAAPLNARYGYSSTELQYALERTIALAESLGRTDSTVIAMLGLWTSRFVQGRMADSYRVATGALATAALAADDPGSDLNGSAHFAVGGSALTFGRPAEALHHLGLAATLTGGGLSLTVGTRPDVHALAWSAHAHWLVGDDAAALASCQDAIALARTVDHPYSLAVALAYGSVTHQMRDDLPRLTETVAELRSLCERYDFAYYREWGLILDGWSQAGGRGIELTREGIGNLRAEGSFARMPYWLSLLADLLGRRGDTDAARLALDGALSAGHTHEDVWWLPEVMRARAAYDKAPAALARLRAAAQMASEHGSAALLRRCEHDLALLDVGAAGLAARHPA
jgi:DNA-binding SARP family transcriptional activator/tetratricopeptide (TPR) repeat protein